MAAPLTGYFPLTGDRIVDGMTTGYYWKFIRFLKLADPCVQNTFSNSKSLGYINNSMALIDDLFDRFLREPRHVFRSLYFIHSNPVLTLLNVY